MSLSKHLQSKELLKSIYGMKPEVLKSNMLASGKAWYTHHPEEAGLIRKNLQALGLSCADSLVEEIQEHIVLHYYEKVLPLCGDPVWYSDFIKEHIDCTAAIKTLQNIPKDHGVLIAIAHFGAVEFIVPALSMQKLPLHSVLRFSTEQFSESAKNYTRQMEATGLFGPIKFIEIGKPGTMVALEMAAALRSSQILTTVFDEKTEYSVPVTLFGKKIWGGAGLDRLIKFANAPVVAFNAFMVRKPTDAYTLELIPIDLAKPDPMQSMFNNLEHIATRYIQQWYFLHEEIPFVD